MAYDRKPKLSDFGITEAQVRKNEYAKTNREKIRKENEEIEKKALITGWSIFAVISVVGLIYCIASGVFTIMLGVLVFGGVLGYCIGRNMKKQVKPLPQTTKWVEDKYQQYLKAIADYEENEKWQANVAAAREKSENIIAESARLGLLKDDDYGIELGMNVTYPELYAGTVIAVDKSKRTAKVFFIKDLSFRTFNYEKDKQLKKTNEPTLRILSIIKKNTPKPERQKVAPPKAEPKPLPQEKITKVYESAGISLTKAQENLFNELYSISTQYCPDVQISEWKRLVGVGVIQQEHLRYWLHTKQNKVWIKFADTQKDIPFDVDKKLLIKEYVNKVNTEYESDPEKYQLDTYKAQQKKLAEQQAALEEKTQAEEPVDEIFDVDETDEISVEISEETSDNTTSFEYDKSIYEIENTTLVKFIGQEKQSVYEIPQGVEELAESCFSGNNKVFELTLPNSVKTIKDNVFKDCKKLRLLILPSSITEIGQNILDGCDNLETVFCETKAVKKLLVNVPKHIEIVCLEF